MEIEIHLL